jgi:hypothetical protein
MVDAATLVQARRQLTAAGIFTEVDLYTRAGAGSEPSSPWSTPAPSGSSTWRPG